jgi:hypothetical protein
MAFYEYAAPRPYFDKRTAPTHVVTDADRDRLQSYDLYDGMYKNQPNTFKVQQRGQDAQPIYLPAPRKCVEAANRFLAVDFGFLVESQDETLKAQITALVRKLFKREQFLIKFASQKRYGLVRGDAFWHLVADDTKLPGERISIFELDPRHVFPILENDDVDKVIGYHLVNIVADPTDENKTKKIARRQTYRKTPEGTITSELAFFETSKWDDRNLKPTDLKPVNVPGGFPPKVLPATITHLPIYQIRNERMAGKPFGFSDIYGFERVFGAVNQAVSDEELTLAMAGLGVYFTTSGPPRNESNEIVPWDMGPARIIEGDKDTTFERVSGVSSVAPMIDHMRFILDETQAGLGIPDIAAGKIDVTVAESGISLQLQLAPLLAQNAEKEGVLIGVYDQMFFDLLHGWMVAYEEIPQNPPALLVSVVGDPLPRNRAADLGELTGLVQANIVTIAEARGILVARFGYDMLRGTSGIISADPIMTQERLLNEARNPDDWARRLLEETGTGTGEPSSGAANGRANLLP